MNTLPHSESCERNKEPILKVIQQIFKSGTVLEVGSGTGQHAEVFSKALPVTWQTADQIQYLEGIKARKNQNNCEYLDPICLRIGDESVSKISPNGFEGIFTANTLHIMSEKDAYQFAKEISPLLKNKGDLAVYGPFLFDPKDFAESNKRFDEHLKNQDPEMGIRSFDKLDQLFKENRLELVKVYEMPANNHLLHYRKIV